MGPRSDERGNRQPSRSLSRGCRASMGPRSDERGNKRLDTCPRLESYASMGPRSDERGNKRLDTCPRLESYASMGPRSDERGNRISRSPARKRSALQWGRARMSAEIGFRARRRGSAQRFNGAALG